MLTWYLLLIFVHGSFADASKELEALWSQKLQETAQNRELVSFGGPQRPASFSSNSARLSLLFPFLNYVDVFYGTQAHGHMFPGVSMPFGMCKMGVDVLDPHLGDSYAGYQYSGEISGVSMLHESGTDATPNYGVVSQLPLLAKSLHDIDTTEPISAARCRPDAGHIGYYKVCLEDRIEVEFSASHRSGLYKYTFPVNRPLKHKNSRLLAPVILVNVSHHLHSFHKPWLSQEFRGGFIQVSRDLKSYHGKAYFSHGRSPEKSWSVSFYGVFDKPAKKVRVFKDHHSQSGIRHCEADESTSNLGVLFEFEVGTRILHSHVGISFRDVPTALANIHNDYPSNHLFDLDWSVENAVNAWNREVFSKISMDASEEDPIVVQKYYNSLYGSHLMPVDKSGLEAPWLSREPYYDDFPSLWKAFRCLIPMFTILDRTRTTDFIRSLIDAWRHDGFLPEGRTATLNTRMAGGSSSDIILADAFSKGIKHRIDWKIGLRAMQTNAERYPHPGHGMKDTQGRTALSDWLEFGYVTQEFSRSLTRTMDYAYNDFAISIVARGLGFIKTSHKYLKRCSNWQQLWNPRATASHVYYRGFIQPKDRDGDFYTKHYDPLSCFGCHWKDDAYMAKPVEYGWQVPYDMKTLKALIGSESVFVERLDDMFGLRGRGFADSLSEPSFMTPYLYDFVNLQYKTSETVDYLIETKFKLGPKGLPRCSGAGSMQAWLWFALSGFFPVAGTDIYLITSPKVSKVEITIGESTKVVIIAHDLYRETHGSSPSYSTRNKYIKNVKLNGDYIDRNWFTHDELFGEHGGLLEFFMAPFPVHWDQEGELPPSPGHVSRRH
ncbi:uncharacterized protein LALA0_S06e02190g [Lachancea lanzarotensis]|uniref:LALA0S06e02190g1_1 n=1 Tax=Lachancea lanzarotensis TaxID=1245769 RepID=A0A0C7N431_9SACH|nr:uncharacterized protein LALA0_S06e02190g [Lachancea lanzarotensis]CEP62721.1 LALA0S06e02190g1_1 [Lachancea lanzarotensis]